MTKFSLPLSRTDIEKCIPHRDPFLLIDQIVELKPPEKIVAIKNVSLEKDVFLKGHFPGNPVMPGVLMIEGMAQAAGVLGYYSLEGGASSTLLTEITQARFKKMVTPKEVLHYEINCTKSRKGFFWFDGVAKSGEEIVATASFSARLT